MCGLLLWHTNGTVDIGVFVAIQCPEASGKPDSIRQEDINHHCRPHKITLAIYLNEPVLVAVAPDQTAVGGV